IRSAMLKSPGLPRADFSTMTPATFARPIEAGTAAFQPVARSVAGLQFRSPETLCARSADPLIAHDFEAESLALIQAGHSCAFEGAYTDQHVNSTVVGLDETIALRDVEPSDGSNCHSASSHE